MTDNKTKTKYDKKSGSAQFFVIGVMIVVSVFSAYIIHVLKSDIYQIHAYSLQMKAYYLADEAASAAVSALLADDEVSLINTGSFPMSDSMDHYEDGEYIGTSSIKMCKEIHPYYSEDKDWIVIYITTSVPDNREGRTEDSFSYSMTCMVLVDNPLIQLRNISSEDL